MATAPDTDDEAEPQNERWQEIFDVAQRRFNVTAQPQIEQRALSLQARRFAFVTGAQWEGLWGEQWENSLKPEINKVQRGVRKIQTDYRQNRIVPDFRPAGSDAAQETADTLDGIHRADSYKFKSQQARDNAFTEAVAGGMGAYRLVNEWDDPYDKDSDHQRINPAMIIVDADQRVFFDGNSKLYDKSDADFCFVLTAMAKAAFEEDHPGCVSSWGTNLIKLWYDWYTPDVVIKAEYYVVEDKNEKLYILNHPLIEEEQRWFASEIEDDELSDLTKMGWNKRERRVKRRRIHKYTMSGAEVLSDDGFIAGDCIPVVPVYGNREYIDNMERFTGHVQVKMDAQRLYNAKIAKLAEIDALAPREVPIFAPQQMDDADIQGLWADQNINRNPYLLAKPLLDPISGSIVSVGPVAKVEPPQLGPVTAALIQIANTDLTEDDQDGADEVKANVSEEAMNVAATRVDAKSGIYLDNMRQSVQREGEIYLSMARECYCEPGRKVETMDEDGGDGEETLQQGVTDKNGAYRVINDFTKGKYKVIASVTEATATRKDKAVKSNLNIAAVAGEAQDQEMAKAALNVAVMNMDGEGSEILAKLARRNLVGMGLVEPNDEEKQEMEQAQQSQQPDPTAGLIAARTQEAQASAALKGAQAQGEQADSLEKMASAALKGAQAHALGGPESPPPAPDGLEQFGKVVDIRHKLAETQHLQTQTDHLPVQLSIEAQNAHANSVKADAQRQKIRKGNEG